MAPGLKLPRRQHGADSKLSLKLKLDRFFDVGKSLFQRVALRLAAL